MRTDRGQTDGRIKERQMGGRGGRWRKEQQREGDQGGERQGKGVSRGVGKGSEDPGKREGEQRKVRKKGGTKLRAAKPSERRPQEERRNGAWRREVERERDRWQWEA